MKTCNHAYEKVRKDWQTLPQVQDAFWQSTPVLKHSEERMVCKHCGNVVNPFMPDGKKGS